MRSAVDSLYRLALLKVLQMVVCGLTNEILLISYHVNDGFLMSGMGFLMSLSGCFLSLLGS